MRVALVHDWMIHMRGGEKVLAEIAALYPKAVLFTLFCDRRRLAPELAGREIRASLLQWVPGIQRIYRWLLPVLPWVARRFDLRGFDLVISSSHCVAKGVRVPSGAQHVCYCHTPMRYAWGFEEAYFGTFPGPVRALISRCLAALRRWDVRANARVDLFLCNSFHVRQRIAEFYGREAQVIYPPCDTAPVAREKRQAFFLVVAHLVPYKRIDLAVDAFSRHGWPLRVVGTGPLERRLKARAGASVEFFGWVDDRSLKQLYAQARALVFPGEEDFGMVVVEAQAQGCPIVAFARGGVLESAEPYEPGTGQGCAVFFEKQTPEALEEAVRRAAGIDWDHEAIRRIAQRYSRDAFRSAFLAAVGLAAQPRGESPERVGAGHAT